MAHKSKDFGSGFASKLRQAELYARNLEGTDADPERKKNEAVRRFFGEAGIPPALAEQWGVLQERRRVRAKAGAPLPPGGSLILGFQAATAAVMAEAHNRLAAELRVDTKAIKLKLKRSDTGAMTLVADFTPPDDWVCPFPMMPTRLPDEAMREVIAHRMVPINRWWRETVGERLKYVDRIRLDVQQPVEGWPMVPANELQQVIAAANEKLQNPDPLPKVKVDIDPNRTFDGGAA